MLVRSIVALLGVSLAAAAIDLPDLPYSYDALAPTISEQTLRTHHTKHHAKYVNTANEMLKGDRAHANLSPEKIIQDRKVRTNNPSLFNNVAQAWNHAFYWKCLTPNGGGQPSGKLMELIQRDFGSFEDLRKKMESEALTCFGSGWAWLGYDGKNRGHEKLVVMKTSGAENPMAFGVTPLLTIDVWEHAYYLDFQEKRGDYVNAYFDKLVNWSFAEEQLKSVVSSHEEL